MFFTQTILETHPKELEEYLQDADKAISEDEEYIRGWKSALLVALEVVHNMTRTEC